MRHVIKASDKLIARRADTKARADFATWQMMVKLNGADGLSDEARDFIARYRTLCARMDETEAAEETIHMVYAAYFETMGGAGLPPPVKSIAEERAEAPFTDNVTELKRPRPTRVAVPPDAGGARSNLPVIPIFIALVLIAEAFHYFWN
jgi:hypothetical protein